MATRQQFADEMNKLYEDDGVYIGTANGVSDYYSY